MTDEQHNKFLEKFANDHSIAKGGKITVSISNYSRSMKPQEGAEGMKIEDTNFLCEQISGAKSFLYWLSRNNYKIVRGRKNESK